jgi:hypothetical protein
MALLFYDGFEGLSTSTTASVATSEMALRGYGNPSNRATVAAANDPPTASPNGRCARLASISAPGTFQIIVPMGGTPTSFVYGFRWWPSSALADLSNGIIRFLGTDNTQHLNFTVGSDGALAARRGSTSLGASAAGAITAGVWQYVEFKLAIDDTNGGVWVRVNGADVLRLGAYAVSPVTLDTRNGGVSAAIQSVIYTDVNFVNGNHWIDDIYVCDLTGPAPYNDFLGPVNVIELLPNAAGASAQWTPSAGTNHEAVDDPNIQDGDTTYVESGTAGHRDLYNLTTATVSSVLAVKTIAVARRTDAGPTELELSVRSGSTTGDSTPKLLADTFGEHAHTFLINPDTTNPWQPGELAGLQAGIKVPT